LSLALYAHFAFSAEFENGTPSLHDRYYYVLASWGELTVAGTLALLACLHAAVLIAVALPGWPGRETQQTLVGSISPGVIIAVAAGIAAGSVYAVTAAVYFAQPVGALLNWDFCRCYRPRSARSCYPSSRGAERSPAADGRRSWRSR